MADRTLLTDCDNVDAAAEGADAAAGPRLVPSDGPEFAESSDFDDSFYLATYPSSAQEIAAGLASTPADHYRRLGRARGFLSRQGATRPSDAAAMPSRFGGLWPDLPNALDLIRGKLQIGQITEHEAAQLTFWVNNGYVVLERAVSPAMADPAALDLDSAYSGGFADLRFHCPGNAPDAVPWRAEINPLPAKALDIHHFSPAIRDLMFAEAVLGFLSLLFEAKTLASHSMGYLRGSAQEACQDSAHVAYSIPRRFASAWFALEDVAPGAGKLFCYPGSHRFGDFIYCDRYKSIAEAERMTGERPPPEQIAAHSRWLDQQASQHGIEKVRFTARKGDVMIRHADLAHGEDPVSRTATRKSIEAYYCPSFVVPLFAEQRRARVWDHAGHSYTSGYYISEPIR